MFKKLFGKSAKRKSESGSSERPKAFEHYIIREIEKSDLVRKECSDSILKHFTGKFDLIKDGTALSAKEKKEMGINARLKITRELLDVLNDKGRKESYPAAEISSVRLRAEFAKSNDDQLIQFREQGIKLFEIIAFKDDCTCDWCRSMDEKRLSTDTDLNSLIENNCNCESHCCLAIGAVI